MNIYKLLKETRINISLISYKMGMKQTTLSYKLLPDVKNRNLTVEEFGKLINALEEHGKEIKKIVVEAKAYQRKLKGKNSKENRKLKVEL